MGQNGTASSNGIPTTERVEAYIRNAILTGELKPRQRITEESLSRALKCSRGPIREAILRLERDGLVESIPRRGTFIPDVSVESIEVVFRMRGKLEGLCVHYMRKEMTPARELRLKAILNDLKVAAEKQDHRSLLEADLLLHQTIWKFSGRPELQRALATIMNSRGFMILTMHSSAFPFSDRYVRHKEYLDAVLHSPMDRVEAEVERHFMTIYEYVFGGSLAQRLIASL